jgi:hypothetical protein
LQDAKTAILIASILGASAGIYYLATLNPLNNYLVFVALFALIGIGVANVILLVICRIYDLVKQYYSNADRKQTI